MTKSLAPLDGAFKTLLFLAVFLVPLWALALTQNSLDFQKQALLAVLVFGALIAWIAKAVNQGTLPVRFTLLHVPVLFVLLTVGISSLFSRWPYASFWGFPLEVGESFLTILAFAVLYFLISSAVSGTRNLFHVASLLVASGTLASVFALLQLYGVFLLPFDFLQSAAANTVGSGTSVALLAAVLVPLALMLSHAAKGAARVVLGAAALALFAAIALLNFQTAWLVLSLGLIVLLAFGMASLRRGSGFGWISFPMALLVVSLFFLVFSFRLPGAPQGPIEVSLSQSAEVGILQEALRESPILGTGPGTFQLAYSQYRAENLNQTIFWGTRFSSGASEVLDWLVTKGALGGAALLTLFLGVLAVGARRLSRFPQEGESGNTSWILALGVFAGLSALAAGMFFSTANFVLWFVFWVFLGLLASSGSEKLREVSVAPPSFAALGASFSFLLILIFGLGLLFVGGQKYAAEARYLEGVRFSNQDNQEKAIEKVLAAATLNPSGDRYWRDLAQLYLARVNQITAGGERDAEEEIQRGISNAVAAAQRATQAAPNNVANWTVQGFVYRNLIGVEGADQAAVASYTRAAELEPASPFAWGELGRVYVLLAQQLQGQQGQQQARAAALERGVEHLTKSVALKADYAPGHFLLAAARNQQGKTQEAIQDLERAKASAPNDEGVALQLGAVYRTAGQLAKAREELERALEINPDYANALYLLGLTLEAQGDRAGAAQRFERVAELNPGNEDIRKIVENLEQGRPALDGVTPQEPPIQQTPPEINEGEGELGAPEAGN